MTVEKCQNVRGAPDKNDGVWYCGICYAENLKSDNFCPRCYAKRGESHSSRIVRPPHSCCMHTDRAAVAQCPNCGAYLCLDCYNQYEDHLCENCTYEKNYVYISKVRNSLIWAGVLFILGWFIGGVALGWCGVLIGLWAAGLPCGFVFTNFDFFATADLGYLGTVFYWILRLLIASVVGWIVTIVNIVKLIHAISVQKSLEDKDIWYCAVKDILDQRK